MTRGLLVVPVLLVSFAVPLFAQGKEADQDNKDQAYKQGLDAREKKNNWAQVEALMRKAIAARGTESTEKVKRGPKWNPFGAGTEYTPHYFLAEALWKQDNCAAAMDEWWRSEQQGVIQKTERLAWMNDGYAACEKKGFLKSPNLEQAVDGANAEISKAAGLAEAVSNRGKTAGDLYNAQQRVQFDEAAALIRDARNRVDSARKTRVATELTEATSAQRKANGILVILSADLEKLIAARDAAGTELAGLERAIDEASGIDNAIEPKRAFLTDALVSRRLQGRDLLTRARRIVDVFRAPGGGNAASLPEGRNLVLTARGHFQQVLDEARKIEIDFVDVRWAAELRLTRQKFTFVDKGFKSFDSRAAARTDTDPTVITDRQALEKRARTALKGLDAAAKARDLAAVQAAGKTADQIGAELERLNLTFGPLTIIDRGVPSALARGSEQFLSGNFSAALEALSPKDPFPSDTPLLEHVHLFRAAAHYELSLRAGSAGNTHIEEAKAALVELRSLNPGFKPDPRYFSPKFLAFFRASGAATPALPDPPAPPVNP